MAKSKRPSQFYATMSTTIVLLLIALFLLIFFHTTNITNIVKENINILVELKDNLPQGEIQSIQEFVKGLEGVLPESVAYITKEEAIKVMLKDIPDISSTEENPFKDLITFNLSNDFYSESHIRLLKEKIELEKSVIGVFYENESIDQIQDNLQKIAFGILALAICFVVLALAIIFNTVKLTLHSDVEKIQTMQMVGAVNSFIKRPYLRDAFWMSIKSIMVVVVIISLLLLYAYQSGNIFSEIIQVKYVLLTIVISFILALLIQLLATNKIINTFLRKNR